MRYCTVHRGTVTDDVAVILVGVLEQGSGPGIPVYACGPAQHRPARGPLRRG
jgi:hypothetical protein